MVFAYRERREHRVFKELLKLSHGLDKRVMRASEQELHYIADMVGSFFLTERIVLTVFIT